MSTIIALVIFKKQGVVAMTALKNFHGYSAIILLRCKVKPIGSRNLEKKALLFG